MKIKLTVSTTWNVNRRDESSAKLLLKEQPEDTILDYIQDAISGDKDFSDTRATAKEEE